MKIVRSLMMAGFIAPLFLILGLLFFVATLSSDEDTPPVEEVSASGSFAGEFTGKVPIFKEIKGSGLIPDEIAQLAVGVAVKYKLLPSVIISQWAYESEWGRSYVAKNDINYFGITWFQGAPFPKGSARGVGGSEGGNYVKFASTEESFDYYGYMVATQSNFNASVNNKSPSDVLLILGRGGYAAAGITESSPYFTGAMDIIKNNDLTKYDKFAIDKWGTNVQGGNNKPIKNNGGYILPVSNPVLSSPYGGRDSPLGFGAEFHRGLDFANPAGTPIMAIADGKVLISGMHYSWGNYIVIQHANGQCSLYAHQSQRIAQVGDTVKQGDKIGLIGSTGDSTGAHLHLEIAKSSDLSQGNLIDPASVLPK